MLQKTNINYHTQFTKLADITVKLNIWNDLRSLDEIVQ